MNAPDKRTLEVLLDHNIEMLEKEESPHPYQGRGTFKGTSSLPRGQGVFHTGTYVEMRTAENRSAFNQVSVKWYWI